VSNSRTIGLRPAKGGSNAGVEPTHPNSPGATNARNRAVDRHGPASPVRSPCDRAAILRLQATAGNRAVQGLLRREPMTPALPVQRYHPPADQGAALQKRSNAYEAHTRDRVALLDAVKEALIRTTTSS
jgi:hypothetical protein